MWYTELLALPLYCAAEIEKAGSEESNLKRMLSGLCERVKSEESHALKIMK